jgi:hypothetical protein
MKLNENQFFLIAVSLIQRKQKLLKDTMDSNCIELINDIDKLLDTLEKSNPKLEGIIDLIYKTENYLL